MAGARRGGPGPAAQNAGGAARGSRRKRVWRPVLLRDVVGSVREGRGFAFRRKQVIERQYRKYLKRRKVHSQQDDQFTDTYPEHLKHLYLAEEEMLKKRRRAPDDSVLSEERLNKAVEPVMTEGKFKKKTSSQKAKEEYEKILTERARKKEEAEKRKQQREEAQRLYKQKKMEAYKILSKRTKRGQPNLNLQMEFLLQKIQQKT
ncbi:thyroid transcription factor 1-associated protein 26 [Falco biarmicus]|uniref:Coiled-coil domain containing 59 n=1 Tax=Falco tinnunculus TaxID=100819 RepID=A0A8C4U6R4_FALTI|nr:thyroid transcription factor 1-associated protein 26 [Falco cherrug]XP_055663187.1 thyroid transcription factor 1-associated protein 26 [Falco peregrinus]XP_056194964.1 thyroid transcription factor 1-associated protein 26 [Falco biarmicus]